MLPGNVKESTEDDRGSLNPIQNYLLVLFLANNTAPIRGRIMLVKQAFLLFKEIVSDFSSKVKFFPYQWGPYSNDVAKAVNSLIEKGLVATRKNGKDTLYYLTPEGQKMAEKVAKTIPPDILEDIERMKRTTQELGLKRVLRFIYSHYPQYAVYSRGREAYVNS